MLKKIKNLELNTSLIFLTTALVFADISIASFGFNNNNESIEMIAESTTLEDVELEKLDTVIMTSDPISEEELLYGTEEEIKELQKELALEKQKRKEEEEANKEYSGMALSHQYENYIVEKSEEYNVPPEVMLCLGNVETGGTWDCTGVCSNGNYGNFQINWSNIKQIHEHFGWYDTIDETREALKDDEEKNAEAAIWIVSRILECYHCQNFQTLCMSYNGSANRVNYAYACAGIMDKYFPGKLEEVEEGIRNYEKPQEDEHIKYNPEYGYGFFAYNVDEIDKKYVKKLV